MERILFDHYMNSQWTSQTEDGAVKQNGLLETELLLFIFIKILVIIGRYGYFNKGYG